MDKNLEDIFYNISSVSKDLVHVIVDFGRFVEDIDNGKFENEFNPILKLPHPKEKIRLAIETTLENIKDEEVKKYLIALSITLDIIVNPDLWDKIKMKLR